ncbi:MAG: TetR/AcrR family transcriptional regulator [Nonlabens sp.]|nr:TetR/AcrR family transcriptional regulator [Nonlabens sp.]
MDRLLQQMQVRINEKIYIKDPESSDLGRRIITEGILLIDQIGFDQFTFKKLGVIIQSNESSIYRYFENKHKLLLYLTSWYWGWLEYVLVIRTMQIQNPTDKLNEAILVLTQTINEDSNFNHINEVALQRIVISEYSKSYLTKEVDAENKKGYFEIYTRLGDRLKEMILGVSPDYNFASSLSSTILEGGLHQHFLKEHFTMLTDCSDTVTPTDYFIHMATKLLS